MKFVFMSTLVFVLCKAETEKEFFQTFLEKAKEITDECMSTTKASAEDLQATLQHKIPASHEGKCLLFCFHKGFHIQNEDGSINKDGATSNWEPIKDTHPELYKKIIEVLNYCTDTAKSDKDPCLYAANFAECVIPQTKQIGLTEELVLD